jgi:hypothetical protein
MFKYDDSPELEGLIVHPGLSPWLNASGIDRPAQLADLLEVGELEAALLVSTETVQSSMISGSQLPLLKCCQAIGLGLDDVITLIEGDLDQSVKPSLKLVA